VLPPGRGGRYAAVSLTPSEFRLPRGPCQHQGSVLSTGQLLQLAWRDPTATGPDRVKFTVLRLRRKLGWSEEEGPLETLRGFGVPRLRFARPQVAAEQRRGRPAVPVFLDSPDFRPELLPVCNRRARLQPSSGGFLTTARRLLTANDRTAQGTGRVLVVEDDESTGLFVTRV